MSAFLTYSELDTDIQRRMSNSAPDSTRRLGAINNSLQELYAEFDIDSGKREKILYIVPDGQALNITDAVPDFKKADDLRYLSLERHTEQFSQITDDMFSVHVGEGRRINEYTIDYNNGKLFCKVNTASGTISKQLHNMGSLTDNGTWALNATSDAVNLTTDEVVTLTQGVNVKFDVDVSNSGNNYAMIEVPDLTAVDLSDYVGLGRFRFWMYIPSVTEFTSVELYWGSSSSDYYSKTATAQADGSPLAQGWNFIEIDALGATITGTLIDTAIDYLAVKVNYTASYTDQTGFRVENLTMFLPQAMKLSYFTYYLSQTSAGVFQEEMTATTGDQLLLPRRFKTLITLMSVYYLKPMSEGTDALVWFSGINKQIQAERVKLGLDIGNKPKQPGRKLKIRPMW
jgi:hypothetical protein